MNEEKRKRIEAAGFKVGSVDDFLEPVASKDTLLELVIELTALEPVISPAPWRRCHNLQSPEQDASCSCGYRGGVWSEGTDEQLFEMDADKTHGGEMTPIPERATTLRNAAFIVKVRNNIGLILTALIDTKAECQTLREVITSALEESYSDGTSIHRGTDEKRDWYLKLEEAMGL